MSRIFRLGVFSNQVHAVRRAAPRSLLLLLVVNVPFLQPVFNTHSMAPIEWAFVLGLSLIPAVAEETTKFFLRRRQAAA